MDNTIKSLDYMDVKSIIKESEECNKRIIALNNETTKQLGRKEEIEKQLQKEIQAYEEKYGVKLNVNDNSIELEFNAIKKINLEQTEKMKTILNLIDSGKYAEVNMMLGISVDKGLSVEKQQGGFTIPTVEDTPEVAIDTDITEVAESSVEQDIEESTEEEIEEEYYDEEGYYEDEVDVDTQESMQTEPQVQKTAFSLPPIEQDVVPPVLNMPVFNEEKSQEQKTTFSLPSIEQDIVPPVLNVPVVEEEIKQEDADKVVPPAFNFSLPSILDEASDTSDATTSTSEIKIGSMPDFSGMMRGTKFEQK